MLLCAARMLKHINLNDHSKRIRRAVQKVIKDGKVKTRDLGGYASTTDFTKAVIENLNSDQS